MNQVWQCTQHTTKMLASTIQISNNNPTPAPDHASRAAGTGRVHPGPQARTEAPDAAGADHAHTAAGPVLA